VPVDLDWSWFSKFVQSVDWSRLGHLTLAAVRRCGVVWFSEGVMEPYVAHRRYPDTLSSAPLDADDEDACCQETVGIVWAFSGGAKLDLRVEMGDCLRKQAGNDLHPLGPRVTQSTRGGVCGYSMRRS
jgi:hypothetical protein